LISSKSPQEGTKYSLGARKNQTVNFTPESLTFQSGLAKINQLKQKRLKVHWADAKKLKKVDWRGQYIIIHIGVI
jgi:hypothetical protein